MSRMHKLPDYYYPQRMNEAYMQGMRDAEYYSDTDRASFVATVKMPANDTPLRREDFFAFDDYLLGFYEGAINRLRTENTNLRSELRKLKEPVSAKSTKNRTARRGKGTR